MYQTLPPITDIRVGRVIHFTGCPATDRPALDCTCDHSEAGAIERIPGGMVRVTRDEFFARLHAATRDIHPTPQRLSTDWLAVSTRGRWGWTSRGSHSPLGSAEVYAVSRS